MLLSERHFPLSLITLAFISEQASKLLQDTMPGYEATTYLLDRSNIEDTVRKLVSPGNQPIVEYQPETFNRSQTDTKTTKYLYYDTGSGTGLDNEVFAPEILVDYGSLMSGGPKTRNGPEWAKKVEGLVKGFSSTQHVVT